MNQPDFFDPPHIALRKQATALRESVAGALTKANELDRLAKECCPHSDIEEKEYYYSGSYYDKAHTTYYTKCAFCGELLSERTEEHSWYG